MNCDEGSALCATRFSSALAGVALPNKGMQLTAPRAAADAER